MLVTTSCRIPVELRDDIEELAARRDIAPSTLIRNIISTHLGHKNGGVADIQDQVQFSINLTIKLLYLVRYISDNIDKEATTAILAEAEEFIKDNGLNGLKTRGEVDYG